MILSRRHALLFVGAASALLANNAFAQTGANPAARIRELLASSSDFSSAKLAFDSLVNPSLDGAPVSRVVDRLSEHARELAGANADDTHKLAAVRTVIYQPGAWNDNRPFAYDMRDPLGRDIQNKLLATYVRRRLGNCVSMPILFLILADRLGLNVGLATAPHHVFVRYTTPAGRAVNLETTSGGHPARDVWYRENMPMTDAAIANGIYMRTLSRRESVAHMAMIVVELLAGSQRHQDVIDVTGTILEHSPNDIAALLYQASAYGAMFTQEFEQRYPTPGSIPPELHGRHMMLAEMNASLFARAEALGWRPSEQ